MAGGGTGNVPCDIVTVPVPTLRGEATKRAAPSQRSAITPPTMSTIESTAPTSWKCTFSTVVPCTAASASARRRKSAAARSFTSASRPEASSSSRMWRRCRCAGEGPSATTSTFVAARPLLVTPRASIR